MILTEKKYGPLVYRKRWFARQRYPGERLLTMYAQFLGETPPPGWLVQKFLTVVSVLDVDGEGHLARMKKGTAYEIRRAEKDSLEFFEEKDLISFLDFYNRFARQKKLGVLGRGHLSSLGPHLWLSGVRQGNQPLAYHAYVVDSEESRARLLYSAQLQEGYDRALLGRANRWLHFQDLLSLQAQGFSTYDWGGITESGSDPQREGINQFKLGFGGEVVQEQNCYSPLLAALRKLLGKS